VASRAIRKVVIFGAGGPVGGAVARELAADYILRLTDVRPIVDIIAEGPRKDQNATAPLPTLLPAPHESMVADVSDPEAVMQACAGMDAVINCTVMRRDPVLAFHVNTLGVYNILRACITHGIRRFVQTGPELYSLIKQDEYSGDYDIPDDAPPRPGRQLYYHSKYLGQEIARVFAHAYGLEVPVLLFGGLCSHDATLQGLNHPLFVSWQDSARAIRSALEVASLPSPYEVFTINADLPHGVFPNAKAKRVLGWQPRDDLRGSWQRLTRRV
jgi:nucleoside-diphosphate-sugar epimerase